MRYLIMRHGQHDNDICTSLGFVGQGLELAPLTAEGERQAEGAAHSALLDACPLIVSSPYTRCMQTAAVISRLRGIPMTVELDLHEWIPDLTGQNRKEDYAALDGDYERCRGAYPDGESRRWESLAAVESRLRRVFDRYSGVDGTLLVMHSMLMHQIKPYGHIPNCFIDSFEYDAAFRFVGYRRA